MRIYPYFVSEAALMAIGLSSLPIALVFDEAEFYALSAISLVIAACLVGLNLIRARDFSESVRGIKGFGGWDADFLSLGTLRLSYRGRDFSYRSQIRPAGKTIPVDYFLSAPCSGKAGFDARAEDGAFRRGSLPAPLAPAAESFGKAYALRRIRLSDGLLEITARLEFERGAPPSKKEKLDDMSRFLEDLLAFACDCQEALGPSAIGSPTV